MYFVRKALNGSYKVAKSRALHELHLFSRNSGVVKEIATQAS